MPKIPIGNCQRASLADWQNKIMDKFVKYDSGWSEKYKEESEKIKDILNNDFLDLEHIGSTSIFGLSAKPIIDIAVLVNSIDDTGYFVSILEKIGYEYKPDMSSVERIFLRKGNPVQYHLSIASPKHTFWERNITFRDFLRGHPEYTKEYEDLKRKNLADTPVEDFEDLSRSKIYNNGKGDFVQKILNLAKN